ncbi:MAG: S8 family serine peptidase [Phycisphaerae bacterium]
MKITSARRVSSVREVFHAEPMQALERRLLLADVAGQVFYDDNLNGVIDGGENGIAGVTLFADLNNNGQFDGQVATFAAQDLPKQILSLSTAISSIDVTGVPGTVSGLTVTIDEILHTWTADLDIYLRAPDGQRVELSTDNGSSGDDYINTTFDDNAPVSVIGQSAPFTGTFRPEEPLSTLNGLPIEGVWSLEVYDDANLDEGVLNGWSITFASGEAAAVTASDGTYSFRSLPAGSYNIELLTPEGYEATQTSAAVDVTGGGSVTGLNFGIRLPPGVIQGTVFGDYDSDGTRDAGEPGLPGRSVYLDRNNNSRLDIGEPSVVTDAAGNYSFENVRPGQAFVRTLLPVAWQQTSPTTGTTQAVTSTAVTSTAVARDRAFTSLAFNGLATPGRPADAAHTTDATDAADVTQLDYVRDELILSISDRSAFDRAVGKQAGAFSSALDLGRAASLGVVNKAKLLVVPVLDGSDPAGLVEKLATLPGVASAYLNYVYTGPDPRESIGPLSAEADFNDPSLSGQYFHTLMQNPQAWDVARGAGITIGVTDDGVAINHPDLAPNIWTNTGEIPGNGIDDDGNGYIDDVNGWDFTNSSGSNPGDNNPNPISGNDDHGTHVAGIAGARGNNGIGGAGTAPEASIVPLRFYGSGSWTSTVIFNTYKYAADNGLNIVTTSYNVNGFANDSLYRQAVDYLYDNDVLHFNSAGNGNALNPIRQIIEGTFYVASTTSSDTRSSFSNYGTGIDISAPGSDILSTALTGSSNFGYSYEVKGGTSMAAPNAAGTAALIWSANPTWTRDQVAAQLLGTADDIDGLNPAFAGLLGTGRVNSFRGVSEQLAAPTLRGVSGLPAEGTSVLSLPGSFDIDFFNVLDPAGINTRGAVRLEGAGLDGVYGTPDDISFDLTSLGGKQYRIATNQMSFALPDAPDSGNFRIVIDADVVTDPFGQPLDGNGDGIGGDDFIRNFSIAGVTVAHQVTIGADALVTLDFGTRENTRPTLNAASFNFEQDQSVTVELSEPGKFADPAGVVVRNVGTNEVLDASAYSLISNSQGDPVIVFNAILPDGDYLLTLSQAGLSDLYGNQALMAEAFELPFFVMAGDADRDRSVSLADFNILASNFGRSDDPAFSEGDFNYDGMVGLEDFNILAGNFGKNLPAVSTFRTSPGESLFSTRPIDQATDRATERATDRATDVLGRNDRRATRSVLRG